MSSTFSHNCIATHSQNSITCFQLINLYAEADRSPKKRNSINTPRYSDPQVISHAKEMETFIARSSLESNLRAPSSLSLSLGHTALLEALPVLNSTTEANITLTPCHSLLLLRERPPSLDLFALGHPGIPAPARITNPAATSASKSTTASSKPTASSKAGAAAAAAPAECKRATAAAATSTAKCKRAPTSRSRTERCRRRSGRSKGEASASSGGTCVEPTEGRRCRTGPTESAAAAERAAAAARSESRGWSCTEARPESRGCGCAESAAAAERAAAAARSESRGWGCTEACSESRGCGCTEAPAPEAARCCGRCRLCDCTIITIHHPVCRVIHRRLLWDKTFTLLS
jgi:hypothetical protein